MSDGAERKKAVEDSPTAFSSAFALFVADQQDRTRSHADQAFRHAAEHQAAHAATTMGAHDHHVGIAGLGLELDALGDFLAGALLADAIEGGAFDVARLDLLAGLGQDVIGGFQRGFAQRSGL